MGRGPGGGIMGGTRSGLGRGLNGGGSGTSLPIPPRNGGRLGAILSPLLLGVGRGCGLGGVNLGGT